jgi:hypothetical protein
MHDRELKQTGAVTRVNPGQQIQGGNQIPQNEVVSQFYPTGGNQASITQGPQNQIQIDIANRKAQREAALHRGPGELNVSVDPVVRT